MNIISFIKGLIKYCTHKKKSIPKKTLKKKQAKKKMLRKKKPLEKYFELVGYNWNEKLSPHFTLKELTKARPSFLKQNRAGVTPTYWLALKDLAVNILEPIRRKYGPMYITSAFRCDAYNKKIGGSPRSQHRFAQAVDFKYPKEKLRKIFNWVYKESGIKFGQIIHEKESWIHISLGHPYRSKDISGQVLTYDGTKYTRIK